MLLHGIMPEKLEQEFWIECEREQEANVDHMTVIHFRSRKQYFWFFWGEDVGIEMEA